MNSQPAVESALQILLQQGKSGKTLNNYLEALRSFATWCSKKKYLKTNPFQEFEYTDCAPMTSRRSLSPGEIHTLLEVAPLHRQLLYEVAFCTGLRAGELRSLGAEHLDSEQAGLWLKASWTKNRKDSFQPLPRALVHKLSSSSQVNEALARYKKYWKGFESRQDLPDRPLLYVPSHTARELDKDLKAAGIPKRTSSGKVDFHACRVAYVSHILEEGATVKEAQTLARHSTPVLTMNVYAKTRDERLMDLTEQLWDRFSPRENTTIAQRQEVETNVPLAKGGKWWRRRESNPRPKVCLHRRLRA